MRIELTVPIPEGQGEEVVDAVAAGAAQMLGQLGLPNDVSAHPGDALRAAGMDVPAYEAVLNAYEDPAALMVARLVLARTQVVSAFLAQQGAQLREFVPSVVLASLAVRDDGSAWPADGNLEDALAARLAPTDAQPLRIGISSEDVERLLPEGIDEADDAIRRFAFESFCVALPRQVLVVDPTVAAGSTTLRLRDLDLPPLTLTTDAAAAGAQAAGLWLRIVAACIDVLVTPAAVEVALVRTARLLPGAAELAERRFVRATLVNMFRGRVSSFPGASEDLPAFVEQLALLPRPQVTGDEYQDLLLEQFPGLWREPEPSPALST